MHCDGVTMPNGINPVKRKGIRVRDPYASPFKRVLVRSVPSELERLLGLEEALLGLIQVERQVGTGRSALAQLFLGLEDDPLLQINLLFCAAVIAR